MAKIYRFKVDKLIRDKLSQLMRQSGIRVFERVMEHGEYIHRLKEKLVEESKEVLNAKTTKQMQEELADVLEVVRSLTDAYGIAFEEIEELRKGKKAAHGGFEGRIYNAAVEMREDCPGLTYYLMRPDDYPEEK